LRKKGSEFAQLRIYSETQLLRNKPKICRICRTVLCVCVCVCCLACFSSAADSSSSSSPRRRRRSGCKYVQSLIPRKSGEKEKTDTLIMQNGGLHPRLCQ
jgi:hypothetical protein